MLTVLCVCECVCVCVCVCEGEIDQHLPVFILTCIAVSTVSLANSIQMCSLTMDMMGL